MKNYSVLSTQKKVGIVLLNWNGASDTLSCISSLRKLNFSPYEIIVVDNGSSDNSIERLSAVDDIHIINNKKNVGYSSGCNPGIRYAINKLNCGYVWLLNNDTVVDSNSLLMMIEKSSEMSDKALIGSTIKYLESDNDSIQCIGGGYLTKFLRSAKHIKSIFNLDKIQYITGASLLIPLPVLQEIGYLDEDFFLYWEDTEYSLRALSRGYKLAVSVDSIIYHKESASSSKKPYLQSFYFNQSQFIFLKKSRNGFRAVIIFFLKAMKNIICLKFWKLKSLVLSAYSVFVVSREMGGKNGEEK